MTAKDFYDKINSDEAFAKEIGDKVKAFVNDKEAYKKAIASVASEYGYEMTENDLEGIFDYGSSELSLDELEKVAGGTSPIDIMSKLSLSSDNAIQSSIYEPPVTTENPFSKSSGLKLL